MSSLSFSEMFIMALIILAKVAFWGAIAYGAYKLYHRMNKSA
jgi:archaellum component FlaG (FlaF/FlaG flagellin family)